MKNRLIWSLVLSAALTGAGALAPTLTKSQGVRPRLNDIDFNIRQFRADLDAANKRLARVQEQYKAGATPQSEVDDAQAKMEAIARGLDKLQHDRQLTASREALMKRVDLQLDHAKVQDLVTVLAKVAGVSIRVDPGVPADASMILTMDVLGVPLASVLEAIAEKADLMIAPDGDGVMLRKWPHLNGRVLRDGTAPWSSDWGVPPTITGLTGAGGAGRFFGGVGGGDAGRGGAGAFNRPDGSTGGGGFPDSGGFGGAGVSPGQNPFGGQAPGGMGIGPGMRPGLPFTMTSIGDHLIAIAEPGVNDRGEPGVWMTAYLFDAAGFHRMGVGFHPFTIGPRRSPNDREGGTGNRLREGTGAPGGKPAGVRSPTAGVGASPGGVSPAGRKPGT